MLILSIRRKRNNVELKFDDGNSISICYETAFKSGLRKNDEINEKQIQELVRSSEILRVKEAAFRYLAMRLHSVQEIHLKLVKKKFSREVIDIVLNELLEKNYLNDQEFSDAFIRQALLQKKSGSMKIRNSLLRRGVKKDIVDDAINRNIDENDILESAMIIAEKKQKLLASRINDPKSLRKKIYSFLINRGFSNEISINVLNRITKDFSDAE